jgi:hypothetical protein
MPNKSLETIRDAMQTDAGFLLKVGAVCVSIVLFIIIPQKDMEKSIALIERDVSEINLNHIIHIQDSIRSIEDQMRVSAQADLIRDMQIAKIETRIEALMKFLKIP